MPSSIEMDQDILGSFSLGDWIADVTVDLDGVYGCNYPSVFASMS